MKTRASANREIVWVLAALSPAILFGMAVLGIIVSGWFQ